MVAQGSDRKELPSPKQVESRWRTMTKQYKAVVDHNSTSGNERKTYKYYNEIDEILGCKPNIVPLATASSSSGVKRNREEIDSENSEDENVSTSDVSFVEEKNGKEKPKKENIFQQCQNRQIQY